MNYKSKSHPALSTLPHPCEYLQYQIIANHFLNLKHILATFYLHLMLKLFAQIPALLYLLVIYRVHR